MDHDKVLRDIFAAAVDAADPLKVLPEHLPPRPEGRVVVVGAGKASARMAQAVEAAWGPCEGLVIVPHGAALSCRSIRIVEAGHPVPDAAGAKAAAEIKALVSDLGPDDFALALISGGGSALMTLPPEGVELADLQALNTALLKSGAPIDEMNVIRKHASGISGGRLAQAAAPARVLTLLVSDVPGDDPAFIASGPTIPDPTTAAQARALVARYDLDLPQPVIAALNAPEAETPDPKDPCFARAEARMIARPQSSLMAAAERARAAGYTPLILGDAIEGEARELGKVMAGIARQVAVHGQPAAGRVALISGGEATVTVRGSAGKGGRCSEFLLALALAGWDLPGMAALACDTDGRDGSEQNAGAIWLPQMRDTVDRAQAQAYLDAHDAYSFFDGIDGLVMTGPTHTNVNDLRVILVETQPGG